MCGTKKDELYGSLAREQLGVLRRASTSISYLKILLPIPQIAGLLKRNILDKAGVKAARIITLPEENRKEYGGPAANILTSPRDIANIPTSRVQAKYGLTNAEYPIKLLQKLSWRFTTLEDKDSYRTDILFLPAKHEHLQLLARFSSALFMDCTFNTNKTKLPFLDVVRRTNKEYHIYCGFWITGWRNQWYL